MSDYIPEEVVNGILLRLPAKSLMKFTAVCKSWRSLIKSSSFIAAHLQFNTENEDARLLFIAGSRWDNTNGFLRSGFFRFYCLHWDTPEFGEYDTNLIAPPIADETQANVIGTFNGLVCMPMSSSRGIVLWNPLTRRYVCSPSPSITEIDEESFCFGYDSVNNDYKVLRLVAKRSKWSIWSLFAEKTYLAEVWSLAKGVWKSLISETSEKPQQLFDFYEWWKNVSVNSALHWFQFDMEHPLSIATFNLANESFGTIELPENGSGAKSLHIMRYGDSLAYLEIFSSHGNKVDCFDLWVMKEYAVAESWIKLCTVDLRMVYIFRPFSFRRSCELVLQVNQREHSDERKRQISLISVNLKSKRAENLGIDGYAYDFVDSFTDSLVLLEQANAISY